jgi:ankyrin repeat protein
MDKMESRLVRNGKGANAADAENLVSLMRAAADADVNHIKLLLEKGADLTTKDRDGHTALDYAVLNPQRTGSYDECVTLLLEAGAEDDNIKELLLWVIDELQAEDEDKIHILNLLLPYAQNIDFEAADEYGVSLFDYVDSPEIQDLLRNKSHIVHDNSDTDDISIVGNSDTDDMSIDSE